LINTEKNISDTAHRLLKKYWGFDNFRPDQLEVIQSICNGNDTIGLFPTGGGKSICFQVPALILPHVSIVITPLIALMEDQVQRLKNQKISAESIHSGKTQKQIETIIENCKWGDVKLLYVSPERLSNSTFQERLSNVAISCLVIDEAHCISQWGHDFRPSYLNIGHVSRVMFPNAITVGFTATATNKVVEDIIEYGGLKNPNVFKKSFKRKNIALNVQLTERKHHTLIELMKSQKDTISIVYIRSRKEVKNLSILLNENGVKSTYYHAGLDMAQRAKVQEAYMRNEVNVICATNAFGMGLDKSDVRNVIHFDVPPSIEDYTQEFGRAGRDGAMSSAQMIINDGDLSYMHKKCLESFPSFDTIRQVYLDLHNYLRIPVGQGEGRCIDFNLWAFSNYSSSSLKEIFHCIELLKKNEYLEGFKRSNAGERVHVLCSIQLIRENDLPEEVGEVLMALVRIYEGILEYEVEIQTNTLVQFCDMQRDKIEKSLITLHDMRWIKYRKDQKGQKLILLKDRLPRNLFHIDLQQYRQLQKNALERTQAISEYIKSEKCRSLFITSYFGESSDEKCGICDNCVGVDHENETALTQKKMEEGLL